MKNLVLAFEDSEFTALKKAKGSRTWREFILDYLKKEERGPSRRPPRGASGPKSAPFSKEGTSGE